MRTQLRLGTRRSLLAWAQSSWVARQIEELNPGMKVELVGIDTRGDKIQNVSLQSIEGKEFFVAELDEALRSSAVDFTVHSMKDLSLERPAEFVCAAIPRRENPRDIILFGPHALERIKHGQALKIGTSSPRRIENIPSFLEKALPHMGMKPRVELVEIRGNVNTRLARVLEPVASERYLDAVVLAFAGLIRLWANADARPETASLLEAVRWMVMPLRECPTAPAQGALAVECRKNDDEVRTALGKMTDPETVRHVSVERNLLAEWGGGCHQRFGATSIASQELETLFYIRGRKPDQTHVDELHWPVPPKPKRAGLRAWDGSIFRAKQSQQEITITDQADPGFSGESVFVAHARAVPDRWTSKLQTARVWTSGVASWFKLAEKGIWVEGCAEGLGFDEVVATLKEDVLQLPELSRWKVLTHAAATEGWTGMTVIPTYRLEDEESKLPAEMLQSVQGATHFFWTSGSQFDRFKSFIPNEGHHSCGPGKTARHLRAAGLSPQTFPSVEEWRKWLEI